MGVLARHRAHMGSFGDITSAFFCTPTGGSAKFLRGTTNVNYRLQNHIIAFYFVSLAAKDGVNEELCSIEGANTESGIEIRKNSSQKIVYRSYKSGPTSQQIVSSNTVVSDGSTRIRVVCGSHAGGIFVNVDGTEVTGSAFATIIWDAIDTLICTRMLASTHNPNASTNLTGYMYEFQYAPYSADNKTIALAGQKMSGNLIDVINTQKSGNTAINIGSEGNFPVQNFEVGVWRRRSDLTEW